MNEKESEIEWIRGSLIEDHTGLDYYSCEGIDTNGEKWSGIWVESPAGIDVIDIEKVENE